jgi:uncharacterized protein YndB with AHSA1/START domain
MDVTHHVNAVRRTVGTRTLEAGEAHVVTLTRTYPTDVTDLWDACTSTERLPRWFAPVAGDLKLGGRYQIEGNASGTVLTCDPPRSFTATWEFGGGISWIELQVTADGEGGARMQLDHIAMVDDDMWPQYGPGAVGVGWDLGLLGLALHLETGASVTADYGEQWSMSAEGKDFAGQAGEGWYAAQVASGEAADVARRAADNTIAFYRGDLPPDN